MDIDKLIDKEAKKYEGRTGLRGIQIPEGLATALENKYSELGAFTLSVSSLNEAIGYTDDKPRADAIKKKLNSQHPIENFTWKVGIFGNKYIIKLVLKEGKET